MKRIAMDWHEVATEGLPDESGWYMTLSQCGLPNYLPYSRRYRMFNTRDNESADEAYDTAIECTYWAEIPAKLKALGDKVSREWLAKEGLA